MDRNWPITQCMCICAVTLKIMALYRCIILQPLLKLILVYERFTRTHASIDICNLKMKQRALLCDAALEHLKTPTRKQFIDKVFHRNCLKKKVTLTAMEADDYETNHYSIAECYKDAERLFLIGKNHLTNSAIIYQKVKLGEKEYYFPYSLITKIDRYMLSYVVPLVKVQNKLKEKLIQK